MNKTLAIALAGLCAVLIQGCSSQPVAEDKPGVEDRTPGSLSRPGATSPDTSPATSGDISSKPLASKPSPARPAAINPLKDPNNVLSRRTIFYDFDSDAIKEEYRPMLQAHAQYLIANRGARMLIQGNADERGSREYNIALGQRRSDAVKRMLVLLGVQESQLESVSLGEEKPRCEDRTEACYGQNRRSDLLYGGEY